MSEDTKYRCGELLHLPATEYSGERTLLLLSRDPGTEFPERMAWRAAVWRKTVHDDRLSGASVEEFLEEWLEEYTRKGELNLPWHTKRPTSNDSR